MRYPSEHKAKTRSKILGAAGRLFRQRGLRNASVESVMSAAGLTVGGFYAHFRSKDHLVAETVDAAMDQSWQAFMARVQPQPGEVGDAVARRMIDAYLSREHLSAPDQGCPMPALAGELSRAGKKVRQRMLERGRERVALLAGHLQGGTDRDKELRARAIWAQMIGAMTIARCLPEGEEQDEMLSAARLAAKRLLRARLSTTADGGTDDV